LSSSEENRLSSINASILKSTIVFILFSFISSDSESQAFFNSSILSSSISKNKFSQTSLLLQLCLIHKISHHHLISRSFIASSNQAQR